ncbi:hypothetical protein ACU686_13665 [Yinghuangia aomiensis]
MTSSTTLAHEAAPDPDAHTPEAIPARARAAAPLLRKHAADIAQARRRPTGIVEPPRQTGVFSTGLEQADGGPELTFGATSRARADGFDIIDTWDTAGLAGSGSRDYRSADLLVPGEHRFSIATPRGTGPCAAPASARPHYPCGRHAPVRPRRRLVDPPHLSAGPVAGMRDCRPPWACAFDPSDS